MVDYVVRCYLESKDTKNGDIKMKKILECVKDTTTNSIVKLTKLWREKRK